MWFPAHWAPVVLRQLQHTEVAPDDIKTQWQEQMPIVNWHQSGLDTNASWKVSNRSSHIEARCHCRGGQEQVPLLGPSLGPRSLQLSVLPNDLSMDEWYAGVYALPTVWPDVSMLGANNLRRVPSSTLRWTRNVTDMYAQVREEEQVISLQFTCSQQDASMRRRKKRKQVDDGTAIV